MLTRRLHSQRCWYIDQADDQTMLTALFDEFGIDGHGHDSDAASRANALERLVAALAIAFSIPFAERRHRRRPVQAMFPLMEKLAAYIEARCDYQGEPNVLAACRQFKLDHADKRTAKYLRARYVEYRRVVMRLPPWLRAELDGGESIHPRTPLLIGNSLADDEGRFQNNQVEPMMMDLDTYLNQSDAARLFGVSPRSIAKWRKAGRLPPPETLPNGRAAWRKSALLACIKPIKTVVLHAAA
jgi:predicted DNA-binding transcriptional regulator AlpA